MRSMPEGVRSMEGLGRWLNMARLTKGHFDAPEDSWNIKVRLRIDVNQWRDTQRPEQGLSS